MSNQGRCLSKTSVEPPKPPPTPPRKDYFSFSEENYEGRPCRPQSVRPPTAGSTAQDRRIMSATARLSSSKASEESLQNNNSRSKFAARNMELLPYRPNTANKSPESGGASLYNFADTADKGYEVDSVGDFYCTAPDYSRSTSENQLQPVDNMDSVNTDSMFVNPPVSSSGEKGDPGAVKYMLSHSTLRCLSPVPSVSDSCASASIRSFPPYWTIPDSPVEKIRERIADYVSKNHKSVLKACKIIDPKSTGKTTNTKLKQLLRTFCIPINGDQYRKLTGNLKKDERGKVDYMDFFRSLPLDDIELKQEVPVKEFSDTENMDELTIKLHSRIHPSLHDVVRSFWLFDYNKDGKVNVPEFRRVIENYCFEMNDKQFEELRKRYDTDRTGLLDYEDFLKNIGIQSNRIKAMIPEMKEEKMLLWEEPCPKFRKNRPNYRNSRKQAILNKMEDPSIQGLSIQDVKDFFLYKLSNCGAIIEKAISMIDHLGTGQIRVNDLHNILNCYAMPMTSSLFDTLLSKLRIEVTPMLQSVDIKQFLDRFCRPDARIRQSQSTTIPHVCKRLINEVFNTVENPRCTIERCMEDMGKNQRDFMTRNDFRRLLTKFMRGRARDEEIREIMAYLDPEHENKIQCGMFLSLFETDNQESETMRDGSCYRTNSEDLGLASDSLKERYKTLKGEKLMSKLNYHINRNSRTIDHALIICDPNSCHLIHPHQLKIILDSFCFPLTDEQFSYLSDMFEYYGDRIDYTKFMKNFERHFDEEASKWCESIDKINRYKTASVPLDELEEILADAIWTNRYEMERDFRALDPCEYGFVDEDDAWAVLCKHVMRLTDEQFKYLWDRFPLNEQNCLLYAEMIDRYGGDSGDYNQPRSVEKPDESAVDESQDQRPQQVQPKLEFKRVREPGEMIKDRIEKLEKAAKIRVDDRVVPKSQQEKSLPRERNVYLESAIQEFPQLWKPFTVIKNILNKSRPKMNQELRRYDLGHDGYIHFATLKRIMEMCGIHLSKEDQYSMQDFFNVDGNSGMINYHDFMRMFI